MSCFPTGGHAAFWAGLTLGKNESAGKNRSGKITPGIRHHKSTLVQADHATSRTKDNCLAAQLHRLASRRSKKHSAISLAHSVLLFAYHMVRDGTEYLELGGDYFNRRNETQLQRHLVKRLESLGLNVMLEPVVAIGLTSLEGLSIQLAFFGVYFQERRVLL
jgi:transposase